MPHYGVEIRRSVSVFNKMEHEFKPQSLEFQREYLGIPLELTSEEKRLYELAREYHERTEAYDRTVCTGPVRCGGIMPADCEQRSLVNRNARNIYDELGVEAANLGFKPKQWRKAVFDAAILY